MHRNWEFLLMDFYSSELMQEHSRENEPFFLPIKFQLQINRKWRDGMFSLTIRAIFINVHLESLGLSSDIKLPINFRSMHSALRFESYWNFHLLLSLNKVIEVDKDFVAFPPIPSTQRNYSPFHNFWTLRTPFPSFALWKIFCRPKYKTKNPR
jgi:hypothetical protein